MDTITYNKANLEDITSAYKAARDEAASISTDIKASIASIKTVWTGSDDVITSRDNDFQKIEENLDTINSYLESTSRYLEEKNESFTSAGGAYRAV